MGERTFRCPQCEDMISAEPAGPTGGPRCARCSLIMLDVGELEDFWHELEGQVDDGWEGDHYPDLSTTD